MKPLLVAFVCLMQLVFAAPGSGQACKPADNLSAVVSAEIRKLVTTNNAVRDSLRLPLVSASQVVIVTDTLVCDRVRVALDSMITAETPDPINLGPRPIYAIKVGTFFAAINPGSTMGHYIPVFFFDNVYSYLSALGF